MRVSVLLVVGLLFATPGICTAGEPEQVPDVELLEFLGTWQDNTGEWVDPLLFDNGLQDDFETSTERALGPPNSEESREMDLNSLHGERGETND